MTARTRFLLKHLAPALFGIIGLLVWERTGLDSVVSGWFYDPGSHGFPLREAFLLEMIGHQLMKELVFIVVCCVIGAYALSFALPELRPQRRVLLFLSLAMTLAPLAVASLKAMSVRHCPWNLQEFGGFAPHLTLFDAAPLFHTPGHCFPGGHASAGFTLLAFYFAGRASANRLLGLLGLWGGLAAGMIFGMARVAQGAHFVSHNLWSAVLCWLVILGVYLVVMGMPARACNGPGFGIPGRRT